MNRLTRLGVWGSAGVVLFALMMCLYTDQPLPQTVAHVLIPFGLFFSGAAYGALFRHRGFAGALVVTVPLFLSIAVLGQLLLPFPEGFSWSYALLFGGTVGVMWGGILAVAARAKRVKTSGA